MKRHMPTHTEIAVATKKLLALPEGSTASDAAEATGLPKGKVISMCNDLGIELKKTRKGGTKASTWRLDAVARALIRLYQLVGADIPEELVAVARKQAMPEPKNGDQQ